jgi:hypothetical protein
VIAVGTALNNIETEVDFADGKTNHFFSSFFSFFFSAFFSVPAVFL